MSDERASTDETAARDFLAGFEEGVAGAAWRLREMILEEAPGVTERVYDGGWKSIWYTWSGGMKNAVAALSPHRRHVNLGFKWGTDLDDPHGLLEGTGKTLRHVKFTGPDEVDRPGVRELVRQAAALGREEGR